ncbi:hypothetical protein [Fontibacillus sp. BL9]
MNIFIAFLKHSHYIEVRSLAAGTATGATSSGGAAETEKLGAFQDDSDDF